MIKYRGPIAVRSSGERKLYTLICFTSLIDGSSTRNTRIERLWVEVGSQFARPWRGFFLRLGRLHGLDRDNPHRLWLLHYIFLDDINKDCNDFQHHWNNHPISGKGHDQTPEVMQFNDLDIELMDICRTCALSACSNTENMPTTLMKCIRISWTATEMKVRHQ
ncbi:hypothetical protein B0H13DRAFT_1609395 [Mycena leptocephala]|nr:hypothetical protein B0H13DRAFT_1609395 [Mycena leptocephala]